MPTLNRHLSELFLLDPNVVFLNHGSFGACPGPVFDAYQQWQLELERQPVEFLSRRFENLMYKARSALGHFLGADADDLVFIPNATTGLNIVARSLGLSAGDEVLTTDHEYGALDLTWQFLCKKWGARYVRRPVSLPIASTEEVIETIWTSVNARTKVLFLSHITSPTAIIFPIEELISRARQAGIITVIDGAHAPGQIPLGLRALGADFYVGNCHKWMMTPKGSAFLYARRDAQSLLEPLVVSWGWDAIEPGPSSFIDHHQWQGTNDIAAYLSVPAAIRFMEAHDWPAVRAECHELLRIAHRRICHLAGQEPITPDSSDWFAQMAAFPLPACDGEELKRRLYDEHAIEVPIIEWNGRQLVRVSIQGYNTPADVKALAGALSDLLT
jgi:isopenicillin-N epimerase